MAMLSAMTSASTQATSLHAAIGAAIRSARTDGDLTQDEVAARLRDLGLRFDRSILAKVEAGTRPLDLSEMVLVCIVLGVGLPALLPADEAVALSSTTSVDSGTLKRILGKAAPGVTADEIATPMLSKVAIESAIKAITKQLGQTERALRPIWGGPIPVLVLNSALTDAGTEPVRKAALRLGVEPVEVALAARRIWDRSLSEERDQRSTDTGDGSGRTARRGHATRQITAEIREHLISVGMEVKP